MSRFRKTMIAAVAVVAMLGAIAAGAFFYLRPEHREVRTVSAQAPPEALQRHCEQAIGEPRVEQVADGVHVAIGFDLANTILIETDVGHVVVDLGMSPTRAAVVREALLEAAGDAPIAAAIFTHSHIDHIGGASTWVTPETPLWATESFTEHLFKQYGAFRPAESIRGARQFGWRVGRKPLPCSALGRRIDLQAALDTGVRLPNRTFTGEQKLEIGGVEIHLVEAHGETHDQLLVWIPSVAALLPGDNYYRTFPNLYTIRGTSPRPVDRWIESLDHMRRYAPEHLIPSHTVPISGRDRIREALTTYRDGIQWVRDRVVDRANRGLPLDEIGARAGLPEHLASKPSLLSLYGQPDWSARAIYTNRLGWFDGRPEALYPPSPARALPKTVALMGGRQAVRQAAREALTRSEHRWSVHLYGLLERTLGDDVDDELRAEHAKALRALAAQVTNTNGRGYLLEAAHERLHGREALPIPEPDDALIDAIPLALLFDVMQTRLIPERGGVHESVVFDFPDEQARFVITVRDGIAEVVEGAPLPGTPPPLAKVRTDADTWRRLALGVLAPTEALRSGRLEIEGDTTDFVRFVQRFRRGL